MKKKNFKEIKFYKDYLKNYNSFFSHENCNKLYLIQKNIENKLKKKNFIFVCGNGGSASIANHFLCDFNKGIKETSKNKILPKIISLSSNIEILSAIANDSDYKNVFKHQIENYARIGDCLITLSCSGNSKNIIEVTKLAKKKKLFIISLTGFCKNNLITKLSNLHLNVNIKNYGICEDVFQTIMHIISQSIRKKYSNKRSIL